MSQCAAMRKNGDRCANEAANPNAYADKSLNFAFCGVHIWTAPKASFPVLNVEQAFIDAVNKYHPIWTAKREARKLIARPTAAREALAIVRRLYPWRELGAK